MTKSTPWPKVLPLVAIVLAVALAAVAAWLWLGGPVAAGGDSGLGGLLVTAQVRTGRRARGGRGRRRGVRPARFEPRRHREAARRSKRGAGRRTSVRDGEQLVRARRGLGRARRRTRDVAQRPCRSRPFARACAAAARRHRQPRERAAAGRSRGRPAGPRSVRALGLDRPAERARARCGQRRR